MDFFGLMKSGLPYVNKFEAMNLFKKGLEKYIDWYNNKKNKTEVK